MLQTKEIKYHATLIPELKYGKFAGDWRYFTNEGNTVGPIYPTKELLLASMVDYLKSNWGYQS